MFFFIYSQFYYSNINFYEGHYSYLNWFNIIDYQGSIYLLGSIIYSWYSHIFLILALILFVAMIGCIVLIANWNSDYDMFSYDIKRYKKFKFDRKFIKLVKKSRYKNYVYINH